jgi:hypothetical protein
MTTKKYETVLRWMTRSPNSLSIWVTGHPPRAHSAKRLSPGERNDNFGSGLIDPL